MRVYVAPAPPPPPPPPRRRGPNRPPTVKARCEPCTVEVGKSSRSRPTRRIPTATRSPTVGPRRGHVRQPGRPPDALDGAAQAGPVPVTVDRQRRQGRHGQRHGHHPGGAAAGRGVHVRRRALRLRPLLRCGPKRRASSTRPSRRCRRTHAALDVEGHTCNIGTAEYNLALGERRANAVRDYLVAAASPPTGSTPSATARSVRSTTTRAKRRAA